MTNAPDIVTVLRAVAVIPEELRPEEFRRLLFNAAETIERLRCHAALSDREAAYDARTISELRDVIAAYREAAEDEPPADSS